jgi:hypothetical protein
LLDSYDILNASDVKLFETYTEDKANFSTANTRDAAARRDAKIARFREEKELKRKLEVRASLALLFAIAPLQQKLNRVHLVSSTKPQTSRGRRTCSARSASDKFGIYCLPDVPGSGKHGHGTAHHLACATGTPTRRNRTHAR